jgi:hypothetical protein
MRLFTFLAIFKYVGLPPPPMINVGEIGLNFLFSVIHTTLNWGEGGIYAVVSIIFAPDCRRFKEATE